MDYVYICGACDRPVDGFVNVAAGICRSCSVPEYDTACTREEIVLYLIETCKLRCADYKQYNRHEPNCPVMDLGLDIDKELSYYGKDRNKP